MHYFDILVCCSGQHQVPRDTHKEEPFVHFTGTLSLGRVPTETVRIKKNDPFPGEVMHSHSYKFPTKFMKGKTVLIVGGGESASDVAVEVSEKAARTILSIR